MRKLMMRATEKRAPRIWGGLRCRKRYADDRPTAALESGVGQLAILGAGLDTRVYRLALPRDVVAFEVDLPATIASKRARPQAVYGRVPASVRLVEADFETADLAEALARQAFAIESPARFVVEAVRQYLTADAMTRMLGFTSRAAAGSRLLFTCALEVFLTGTRLFGADEIYRDFVLRRRIWRFGTARGKVPGLRRRHAWDVVKDTGAAETVARHLAPRGRDLPISALERAVEAVRR